ncbi:MAG: M28 family peptidase [Deltaproteobacteria bacterium]|nr:M28 family peptidase [Deltaproteobacteria bacterium]MDQ3298938.1 M28 family peptidase [Myxococcota bacterium]
MRWLILCVVAAVGCRGEAKPKRKAFEDAAVPIDAPRVTTAEQRDALFASVPTAKAVRGLIERLAAKPHVAGTKANEDVAKEIMRTLGRMGWKLGTAQYGVYMPLPKRLAIHVRGDKPFELAVTEAAAAGESAPELLAWNAYSASGTVSAPVVYASYGRATDFAALKQAGVDVKGKVALLRYGPLYRGAQVASAERAGAAAVIFYVDPEDEPTRPRDTVQRGTALYYWQYPGDPLTPGVPASPDAPRKRPAQVDVLPKIPVLNVTADEAAKLLAVITGPQASPELAGGLAAPYHLGPGPVIEVAVELDTETRPIRNVIAIFDGKSPHAVVLGNHYDAWGYGAVDPHSGTAALIEIARGLRALQLAGWRPRRTIIIGFWDAEEMGMIGSTEWVEDQAAMLAPNAVAYFNIDSIKAGPLVVGASPALREHVRACAHDSVDPATGKPFEPAFEELGIGSDWTAFLHHAGIASLQWRTGKGTGTFDVWHSLRDDATYAGTKADPDFAFIPAFAKLVGGCAVRLADAEYLPLRYSETATWLADAITALDPDAGSESRPLHLRPTAKLDRTKLDLALAALREAATRAEAMPMKAGGDPAACNGALTVAERGFLAPDGLVGRPWYRHLATGPDPENGYGARLLPELAAAIAAKDAKAIARATDRLADAITRVAAALEPCR